MGAKGVAQMQEDSALQLTLSVESLLCVLHVVGLRTLPGLGEDVAAGLSEPTLQIAREAGANALRAAGLAELRVDGGNTPGLVLDTTLAALVLTCATAPRILYLARLDAQGRADAAYVHLGPHLAVVHTIPQAGVHRFLGLLDEAAVCRYAEGVLRLQAQPAPRGRQLHLTKRLAAEPDEAAGGQPAYIQRIAAAVGPMVANTLVAMLRIGGQGEPSTSEGFSLLQVQDGFWLVETETDCEAGARVSARPASAEACRRRLVRLL